jgi:hypothetical protein
MLGAGDEELLVEGISDLLPQNTQVFPSTPRAGLLFYVIVWLGGALSILLGLAALARAHDVALYGAAGGCGVAVLAAAFAVLRCTAARHAAAVRAGELHEGIIVFPTGDIVVRFSGCAPGGRCGVDLTVEAAYLSRAAVVRRCSLPHVRGCGRRAPRPPPRGRGAPPHDRPPRHRTLRFLSSSAPSTPTQARVVSFLELTYLMIDARPTRVAIAQTDLRDSVAKIAEFINAQKGNALALSAGGGLFGM